MKVYENAVFHVEVYKDFFGIINKEGGEEVVFPINMLEHLIDVLVKVGEDNTWDDTPNT